MAEYLIDGKYPVTKEDCDGGCYMEYFFEDRFGKIIRHRDRTGVVQPDALDPEGALTIPFKMSRNPESWGISFEYSAGSSPLEIYDRKLIQMFNKEKLNYGYDGCITVTVIMVPCCCEPEIVFQGLIDFWISSFVDCLYWEIQLRKEAFESKFENRLDVKVAITDPVDVDGVAVTAAPVHQIGLHSQEIQKARIGSNGGGGTSCVYPNALGGPAPAFTFFSIPLEAIETNSIGWVDGVGFTIDQNATVNININSLVNGVIGTCLPLMTATLAYSVDGVETIVGTSVVASGGLNLLFPFSLTLFMLEDQTFNIYFKINNATAVGDCQPEICFFHTTFDITYNSVAKPTCSQSLWIHGYLAQQVKLICGDSATINAPNFGFVSDGYAADGCFAGNKVLNGHWLRQNPDPTRTPRQSLTYLFESLSSIFAVGYSIEEIGGAQVVNIGDIDFYFNEVQGLVIAADDVRTISYEPYSSYAYNEALFGYRKSAIESDDVNSLDEIHSTSEYLLCVSRNKQKLSKASQMIASGQLIEDKRRESFATTENTSQTYDTDLFIISSYHVDSIGPLDITFNFGTERTIRFNERLVVCPGQSITITGTGATDGTYTVVSVDFGGGATTINVQQDPGVFVTASGTITIDGGGICQAYRDQQFDQVLGITSPETTYNLIHTPLRQLFRWGKWLNSSQKPLTPCDYRWQAGEGGRLLETEIKDTPCKAGDIGHNLIQENADIPSVSVYLGAAKFCPELVKIELLYTKERLDFLRQNKYNYISVVNPCTDCGESETIEGWIMDLQFQPFADVGVLKIEMIRKA